MDLPGERRRAMSACPRRLLHIVCAAVLLSGGLSLAVAQEPESVGVVPGQVNAGEVSKRLRALTPQFEAPIVDLLEIGKSVSPVVLLGVDLLQNGVAVPKDNPRVDSFQKLQIVCYWLPQSTLTDRFDVEFRFSATNPLITVGRKRAAGPKTKEVVWHSGNVYRQEYLIDLSPVATVFCGKTTLTVETVSQLVTGVRRQALQTVPLVLTSLVRGSAINPALLESAFGDQIHDLGCAFVLAEEGTAWVPIDPALSQNVSALGLVSFFGYGNISQGMPVCEVTFVDASGTRAQAVIQSGVTTARADRDFFPPDQLDHQKIAVVESMTADYLSKDNKTFERHKYKGVLEVPPTIQRLVAVEFKGVTDRAFEVHDVVLIYGNS